MRLPLLLALLVLAGCGWPFAPAEFWCAQTHYFTTPDTATDPPPWSLKPDSVITEWSVGGECPA